MDGVIGGSGEKYFYETDHLGSPMVVTDQGGQVVWRGDYAPFGEKVTGEDAWVFIDTRGFTGKDWDEDVGLYYFNARWYHLELGRFISEDPINEFYLYQYCNNNPLLYIDPSGMVSIDSIVSSIKNWWNRNITGNYFETTVQNGVNTGINGVTYSVFTTKTYRNFKLISSITIQTFINEAGDVIIINTEQVGRQVIQSYSIVYADGTVKVDNQTIEYKTDYPNQRNLIAVENFVNDPQNPGMNAPMLIINRSGVTAGFLGSTLPQGGYRNDDGTYSTLYGKVISEGIYEMYTWHHGNIMNNIWNYDNAIQLRTIGNGRYIPCEASAVYDDNGNPIMFATGVNIHSGQASGRASSACQNIAPHSNWFSIEPSGLQRHLGVPLGRRRNPPGDRINHHTVTHDEQHMYWPTWAAFSDIMVPHNDNIPAVTEQFIGYYYLNRL